ncbi:hypothetical protein CANTEDRAFT_123169 [Yamadazyma tenuis ATCC 10573]|uniref:RNA polymerase II-associated protein RBA50 n=1 Tax=Candida tenuis (strain ATCC 10573 / BCRC 21748 / CBS 615 / JCM 9827 / NBRC 10315 / NRRL Y-1498 / VKM Y-70) TaxID=590646 RepID=G3B5G4_CANTC|nr:uncharacterized protein CANTEDRAFT_123169 [Yamadazyma tenuis ATCC 10573]EGV63216.1 hypothetical protein CANTEDRAFT_123169 [Yamadazyma tenuis ATCC 10573]
MDLVGEIVEKDVGEPTLPLPTDDLDIKKIEDIKKRRESAFTTRLKGRNGGPSVASKFKQNANSQLVSEKGLSEAEKIHKENMEKLGSMSAEEINQEREELLAQLNPDLIQSLMKRAEKREKHVEEPKHTHHEHRHAEGYGEWIGGMKTEFGVKDLTHLDKDDIEKALGISSLNIEDEEKTIKPPKKVRFDTNQEIAPDDYQLVNEDEGNDDVHFTKPKGTIKEYGKDLDLNDPEFYDQLHQKYYPDLPKETSKLAWMTEPVPVQKTSTYESISDMRFDFQGNLIELHAEQDQEKEIPTYLGLHHHSANPHLPGYTLGELVHLSRSVVAGQRCLSIQMLGRILHKLGLHKYNIMPISDDEQDKQFNESVKQLTRHFEKMMWDLIDELRVIESISEASDEKKSTNISVRNYAVEALWLWRQGGGRPKEEETTIDEEIAQII